MPPAPESFGELHRRSLFGEAGGRILWQPRIGCWYDDRMFSGVGLPEPYTGLDLYGLYRALGCSARLYEFNACFRRAEDPAVRFGTRELGGDEVETVVSTPVGSQRAVHRRSRNSPHPITVKWEIKTAEELAVATWREARAHWSFDAEIYRDLLARIGDLGAPTMFMPRMNIQCLYLEKMGVERGVMALYEWPEAIGVFFRELEASHDRLIDAINASPVEIVNYGENVHAGTLSPPLFAEHHLPACQRRSERLHAGGKFVSSHWDGDVKALLPYARETGLDGIEAITPVPQGDVTLEEVRDALGEEMFLLDGIPAVYFDDTYPVETLLRCTERVIELFAPNLLLGISDEISSTGDIERVRLVSDIVDRYNEGRP
jgi:uroporphyrinogen decarboxylase-like protein